MKKTILSMITAIGIAVSSFQFNLFTTSAICCRKDGFDKSRYTLTGNMA